MPAEWEPHEATWLSWPQPGCNSFPGSYDRVVPTFIQMVVAVTEEDENDPNFEPLRRNLERLREMRLPDGEPLHVLNLPMPRRIVREGIRLPASYANFYIANEIVLLPLYGESNDAWAESVLREAFPKRKIVGIDCRELIWGLGALHCLTQQQPAL